MIDAGEILGRRGGNDSAFFEEDDARGKKKSLAKIVSDKDDGFVEAAGEGAEFALKLGARDGIEGAKGLVHQENRRVGGKGAGDANTLALAAGKFVRVAGRVFGGIETDQGEEFVDAGSDASGVPFFERRDQGNVLGHREVGEKTCVLNDIADAAAEANGVPVGSGAALDENLAGDGEQKTVDEF